MDKLKILYVDDERLNLEMFKMNLEKNYDVLIAGSGLEALRIMKEHADIVVTISDMRMPSMSGTDFIRKAKSSYPDIAYFILTGYGMTPELSEAIEEGLIIDCLSKPMQATHIDQLIQRTIKL